MAKKKKKKSNIPRHKRMNRKSRLQSAKHWIPKYGGKNIIKGYSKHFAVDKLCAIKELEMLDIEIDLEYVKNLKQSLEGQRKAREKRKRLREEERNLDKYPDSDETYAFIVGYTSGGFPYGVRWDEFEGESYVDDWNDVDDFHDDKESEETDVLLDTWEDDIPF